MRHRYITMDIIIGISFLVLLVATPIWSDSPSWSQQLSSYTSGLGDWVPLSNSYASDRSDDQQFKRQTHAQPRVLNDPVLYRPTNYQDSLTSSGFFQTQGGQRQLYLQTVPSAPQNYLTDQTGFGQSLRLPLGQPQNFPLAQGFAAPQYNFDQSIHAAPARPDFNQRFQQTIQQAPAILATPMRFETYQKQLSQNPPELKAAENPQSPKSHRQEIPKFIDGYKLDNASSEYIFQSMKKKPQSLQKLKLESTTKAELTQNLNQRKMLERYPDMPLVKPTGSNIEREEVQLLYVPVEALNRGQFNLRQSMPNAHLNRDIHNNPTAVRPDSINQAYMPGFSRFTSRPQPSYQQIQQDFLQNALNAQKLQENTAQAIHAQKLQESSVQAINQQTLQEQAAQSFTKYQQTTAPSNSIPAPSPPKHKKLKPHQPPLAVFMVHDLNKGESVKVSDVLATLKNIGSVPVLDSVSPTSSPRVFIGPSILKPPENYAKFELPYLSNIENSERRLRQLPFFVAPLSYKTPEGFAKIPFPSPHVGSVIVNAQMKDSFPPSSTPVADVFPNSYTPSSSVKLPTETFTSSFQTEAPPRPTFSYFSTVNGNTNVHTTESPFQSNFFSFEPQPVAPFKPLPADNEPSIITAPPGSIPSYFSPPQGNLQQQYVNFPSPHGVPQRIQYQSSTTHSSPSSEYTPKGHYITKLKSEPTTTPLSTTTTTSTTTVTQETTTSKAPPTLPNSLIETHNPFSINQAFEYSSPFSSQYPTTISQSNNELTPKDYSPNTPIIEPQIISETPQQTISEYDFPQSYNPNIEHKPEIVDTHFTSFDGPSQYVSTSPRITTKNDQPAIKYNNQKQNEQSYAQSYPQEYQQHNPQITADFEPENIRTTQVPERHQPESYTSRATLKTTATTQRPSTTTTTNAPTSRRPLNARGRPRYTTLKPAMDLGEVSTRAPVTRRPLRERRPLPSRSKYEPSKIQENSSIRQRQTDPKTTTEGYVKSTTKNPKIRNRGRLQPKVTEKSVEKEISKEKSEDSQYGNKRQKTKFGKDDSLAYQRDVLHQNYPVTLMERMSTVDVEDTTPYSRPSTYTFSSRDSPPSSTETYDKYKETTQGTQSKFSIYGNSPTFEESSKYITKTDISYDGETYPSISISTDKDDSYDISTESKKKKSSEEISYPTTDKERGLDPTTVRYNSAELSESRYEDIQKEQIIPKNENSIESFSQSPTLPTPAGFKTRQRQRQHSTTRYQPSVSTESSVSTEATRKITASEYRRMSALLPVTYRPAFDRRRTTMRIEEIEADLKTKEVHVRPDYKKDNVKHPIYKPESSTEPLPTTIASETSGSKRISQFRRRRPSISSTSTTASPPSAIQSQSSEYAQNKRNRFKSRGRPSTTERALEIQESGADSSYATTPRSINSDRFSTRTRAPYEKFSRRPTTTTDRVTDSRMEESYEDQAPHSSINRPQFLSFNDKTLESPWSPKLSSNSFKPINPNMISSGEKSNSDEYGSKVGSPSTEVIDIITVDNQFEDVLIAVTPASNKLNRKFPDNIQPVPKSYVRQTQNDPKDADAIETFESVLEEVMRNLEEQDEDEYNVDYVRNVKKHERGEIGEIPPEKVISFGLESVNRGNLYRNDKELEVTTLPATTKEEFTIFETSPATKAILEKDRKGKRRGVWKRVNVRPVTKEPIQFAESQYYTNTANTLLPETTTKRLELELIGNIQNELVIPLTNNVELQKEENKKVIENIVGSIEESTTYSPETFDSTLPEFTTEQDVNRIHEAATTIPSLEEYLVNNQFEAKKTDVESETEANNNTLALNTDVKSKLPKNPGDMDLGTGAPDSSLMEFIYRADKEAANLTPAKADVSILDNSKDVNGVMDYLLGVTSTENENTFPLEQSDDSMEIMDAESDNMKPTTVLFPSMEVDFKTERSVVTEISQNKLITSTEGVFIPDEIATTEKLTALSPEVNVNQISEETSTTITQTVNVHDANKIPQNEIVKTPIKVDNKSLSNDPWNLSNAQVSMSMSTEISEETEICFRGKCIKTKKDNL